MPQPLQPGGRAPAPAPLDLVQDFVNTDIPELYVDELATPEQLGAWLVQRGLLVPGEEVGADSFVAARRLREAFRRLALANTEGAVLEAEDIEVLGGLPLRAVSGSGALAVGAGGTGVERALASIVAAALEGVGRGDWTRLKACRKESCGWVFYDASRNRASSWCSMSICGNRAKTAAYRRRRADG